MVSGSWPIRMEFVNNFWGLGAVCPGPRPILIDKR